MRYRKLLLLALLALTFRAEAIPFDDDAIDIVRENAGRSRESLLKDHDYKCLTDSRRFKSVKELAAATSTFCVSGFTNLPTAQVPNFNFKIHLREVGVSQREFAGQVLDFKKSAPVKVNGTNYFLVAKNLRPCKVNPESADFQVFLSDGKSESMIRDFSCVDAEDGPAVVSWDLIWSGDLDGDGKPDFYITYAADGVHFTDSLYLSSRADSGETLKLVSSKSY